MYGSVDLKSLGSFGEPWTCISIGVAMGAVRRELL